MRLKNEQYEEIKQIVIETFEAYDVKSIPISAFEMAFKMGIIVVPYSSLSVKSRKLAMAYSTDGYSVETGNAWTIYYNDACRNYGRINQTIMHEIGHFALGHTEDGDKEEKEAEALLQDISNFPSNALDIADFETIRRRLIDEGTFALWWD